MKSEYIDGEIGRLKRKIDEYQQRVKELERRKIEQENTEIVALVRNLNVKPGELSALLERLRAGCAPDESHTTESEEPDHEA